MKDKTVVVRIKKTQENALHPFSEITGCSISRLVQNAVDLLIAIEGPVWEAEGRALQDALKKRHDVAIKRAS
jgi:hypothetical protein